MYACMYARMCIYMSECICIGMHELAYFSYICLWVCMSVFGVFECLYNLPVTFSILFMGEVKVAGWGSS